MRGSPRCRVLLQNRPSSDVASPYLLDTSILSNLIRQPQGGWLDVNAAPLTDQATVTERFRRPTPSRRASITGSVHGQS